MAIALLIFICFGCNRGNASQKEVSKGLVPPDSSDYHGFANQIAWGKFLVQVGGCGDCHTPKKMTPAGIRPDMSMYLAGFPANAPTPQINRKKIESKGLMVTKGNSVWIGPWGITYSANITPDETGIGSWTKAQFIRAIRKGKWMGEENSRHFLPPMNFVADNLNRELSDNELKAVFAYLKSIKPVHNVVPAPVPPVSIGKHE
jgi:mono/diheme cytochrome c family protein